MNPMIAALLCLLVSASILAAGIKVGLWVQREREELARTVLQRRVDELIQDRNSARTIAEASQAAAARATRVAHRAVKSLELARYGTTTVTGGVITGDDERPDDPPTTGQADRRLLDARRASRERERTSDDRIAVRIKESDMMPAPMLRDAADDH